MPGFNVYELLRTTKARWSRGEISSEELLKKYAQEVSTLHELWNSTHPTPGNPPILSYFPLQRSRRGLFIYGNGKQFQIEDDDSGNPDDKKIYQHLEWFYRTAVEQLESHIKTLKREIQPQSKNGEGAKSSNDSLNTLLSENRLVPNVSEPGTYRVVKSLRTVMEAYLDNDHDVSQEFLVQTFRKMNGSAYSVESVRIMLNSVRKDYRSPSEKD